MNVISINILIVDKDSPDMNLFTKSLEERGFRVFRAKSVKEAAHTVGKSMIDIVFITAAETAGSWMKTFRKLKEIRPDLTGVIITDISSIDDASDAFREPGIEGYEKRPADNNRLLELIEIITINKQHQNNVESMLERYMTMSSSLEGILYEADEYLTPVFILGSVEEITGYNIDDFLSGASSLDKIIHPEDIENKRNTFISAMENPSDSFVNIEYRITCKNSQERWVLERMRIFREGATGKIRIYGAIVDVTDRKKVEFEKDSLQLQLLHSQKMDAVGRLAAGIAHDFNNILAVIMGNASFGLNFIKKGEPGYKQFKEIMSAAGNAKDLTMQMLSFARKEKLYLRKTPVRDLVKDLSDMLERGFPGRIKLQILLDKDPLPARIDTNQILQALLNICNNAKDSIPEEGVVVIKTHKTVLDREYCRRNIDVKPGKYCMIQISDNGQGISEENLHKIFEPFFSTKATGKGTGLGLSVTLGIIQNHGGHIRVESEPDKGSIFTIYLPLVERDTAD